MNVKRRYILVLFLFVTAAVQLAAERANPYLLTDFPVSLIAVDSAIWIKWTGASRNPFDPNLVPDSGRIYFNRTPGGSVIANYKDSITKRIIDTVVDEGDTSYTSLNNILFPGNTEIPPQRGIKFRPSENGMSAGTYYIMVAWRTKIGLIDTTFYSNEVPLIIEIKTPVTLLAPKQGEEITDLTPTFQWQVNPGVPYYHIIVSDEKIAFDQDSQTVEGLSIIWQAITSNTQMTYGAPDPSGTITADPPPISPGKEYGWAVLNNYGNHMAYSSTRFSLPSSFKVGGIPLKKPKNVWKYNTDTLLSSVYDSITFKWTNLDSLANTYKMYIYVASDFEGVGAQMVVWSNEVTAGQFTGDTASYTFYAKTVLTDNYYTWKVIAIDEKGAGTSGDTTGFRYSAPAGTIVVKTVEEIKVGTDIITKNVGLVEVKVEVLDGSLEAPLLFYTDQDGDLNRKRPTGTYKLTALKNGFNIQTKTTTLTKDEMDTTKFFLERPDATIYGKVVDGAAKAVGLATIIGVSDRGDTISTQTDQLGSFILTCYEADWTIAAMKEGYITSNSRDTSVVYGQSCDLGEAIVLKKNPLTLSGIVSNTKGQPLIGVKVELLLSGTAIGEVPSTPQTGAFSFSVEPGTYTLKVTKVGFTSYSKSHDILSSTNISVSMTPGAALIKGSILGRSWNASYAQIFAPITKASVYLVDTSVTPFDTLSTTTGSVYGDFELSITGGNTYHLYASANGYTYDNSGVWVTVEAGKTYSVTDTLLAYASVNGTVRMSDTATSKVANVSINIIDTSTNTVVASVKSDAVGDFQVTNLPNGANYSVQASGNGLIADTLKFVDTAGTVVSGPMFIVTDGLAKVNTSNNVIESVSLTVKSGTKALQWYVYHGAAVLADSKIKLQSPLTKTLTGSSVLGGVGVGDYIMSIDAISDTIIDCSYHRYTIPISVDSLHTDSISMPVAHYNAGTLSVSQDSVTLTLSVSSGTVASAYVYYKDISAGTYDSSANFSVYPRSRSTDYTFRVHPQKDGSYLMYYFKVQIGANKYGYDRETYRSYIVPDSTTLSRLEVTPSSALDTLLFPADEEVTFVIKGYYGSKFSPASQLGDANVTWSFVNAASCAIKSQDKDVVISTGSSGTGAQTAILQAAFHSTATCKVGPGMDSTVLVYLKASSSKLDSIAVLRVDSDVRTYITTSPADKAEFHAIGYDGDGIAVTITPEWETDPDSAGTIDVNGVFRPLSDFLGRVKIAAKGGDVSGAYYSASPKGPVEGLDVHYLVPLSIDTVNSRLGCQIVIPAALIDSGVEAEIQMQREVLKDNIVKMKSGDFDLITPVFNIKELKNAEFNYDQGDTADSMVIVLDIPAAYQSNAKKGKGEFYAAVWNEDSLQWQAFTGSQVAANGKTVSVNTIHFSEYAIIYNASATSAELKISPNPFSPHVQPVKEYGRAAPSGTCLEVTCSSPSRYINFEIGIYTITGDKVWSVSLQHVFSGQNYRIWWDGKTTNGEKSLDKYEIEDVNAFKAYSIPGQRMCRNGRYFAVLTVDDLKKKKNFTKQVILFK